MHGLFNVVGHATVERHVVRKGGASGEFVHVAVGSVKQGPAGGCCQHGNGIWKIVSAVVGALKRVNGDVDLRGASLTYHRAKFFANVQHGGIVPLPFADGHSSIKRHGVEGAPHGFNGSVVSSVLVALSSPGCGGDGCLVDGFDKVVCKVANDAHEWLESRERHQVNGSVSLEFLDDFKVGDAGNRVLTIVVLLKGFYHVKSAQKASSDAGERLHFDACFVVGADRDGAPQTGALPRPVHGGSLERNGVAMRDDTRGVLDGLNGGDRRSLENVAFLDFTRDDGVFCGLAEQHPSTSGCSSLNHRLLSDVDDAFNGFLAQPNPSFQVSPSVVTSFFHMGACFFNSSMSHSHA